MKAINIIIDQEAGTYSMVYRNEEGKQTNQSISRKICYSVSDFVQDCVEFGFDFDVFYNKSGKLYLTRSCHTPAMLVDQAI